MQFEKMIFQHYPHTNEYGSKFDCALERSKVDLGSSFKQIWVTSCSKCYIPRFNLNKFILFEKILSVFTIYGHAGHPDQHSLTIRTNLCSPNLMRRHMKFNQTGLAQLFKELKIGHWIIVKIWWQQLILSLGSSELKVQPNNQPNTH